LTCIKPGRRLDRENWVGVVLVVSVSGAQIMKRSLIPLVLAACLAAPVALAEEVGDRAVSTKPAASTVARQESLELPGLTACHQCEWRPKPNQMAAAEQCGTGPNGAAKVGLFECGFSQECERVCNFVECLK